MMMEGHLDTNLFHTRPHLQKRHPTGCELLLMPASLFLLTGP